MKFGTREFLMIIIIYSNFMSKVRYFTNRSNIKDVEIYLKNYLLYFHKKMIRLTRRATQLLNSEGFRDR